MWHRAPAVPGRANAANDREEEDDASFRDERRPRTWAGPAGRDLLKQIVDVFEGCRAQDEKPDAGAKAQSAVASRDRLGGNGAPPLPHGRQELYRISSKSRQGMSLIPATRAGRPGRSLAANRYSRRPCAPCGSFV
jgi:hypothetical protein